MIKENQLDQWTKGSEASRKLGFSEKTLNCWRDCGYLKAGKHWKISFDGQENQVFYQVKLCSEEMNIWWGSKIIEA